MRAAALTPQTFNSFYIDNRHLAEYTAGLLPIRAPGAPTRACSTRGGGAYEWRGDGCPSPAIPHGVDPAHTPVPGHDGQLEQHRRPRLRRRRRRVGVRPARRPASRSSTTIYAASATVASWTIQGVVSAMNEAASQDVRGLLTVPLLARVLHGSPAPDPSGGRRCCALLVAWNRHGASLLGNGHGQIRRARGGDHAGGVARSRRRGDAAGARPPARTARRALSQRFGGYSPGGGPVRRLVPVHGSRSRATAPAPPPAPAAGQRLLRSR